MLKRIILLGVYILCVLYVYSQSETFQMYSKDTNVTRFESSTQTKDGNYLLIGESNLYSTDGKHDVVLIKMNKNSDIIWSKIYGYNNNETELGKIVLQTKDNGFLICSAIKYYSPTALNLIKTDSIGNVIWSKRYDQMSITQILKTPDNSGYIIVGNGGKQNLFDPYKNRDILLMKVDLIGNPLWSRIYGGVGEDMIARAIIQDDGSIVVCGKSSYSQRFDAYVIKVNSDGKLLWSRTYIFKDYVSDAWSITKLKDGGYALLVMPQQDKNYQLILKIDSIGIPVWNKLYLTNNGYNTASIGGNIYENANGDLVSLGAIFISNYDYTPSLLLTDKDGNVKWHRHYDHFDKNISTQMYSFTPVSDGYLLTGETSDGNWHFNMCLIKTDTLGYTGCSNDKTIYTWTGNVAVQVSSQDTNEVYNVTVTDYPIQVKDTMPVFYSVCGDVGINDNEELKMKNEELRIYPNPFTTIAIIEIETEKAINNWRLEVYNVLGNKVKDIANINTSRVTIDRKGLDSGIYYYKLQRGGEILGTGKFVVQ